MAWNPVRLASDAEQLPVSKTRVDSVRPIIFHFEGKIMEQRKNLGEGQNPKQNKKKTLAVIGCVLGFVALSMAFLSPWIAAQIDPPREPIEAKVADLASRIKEATKAKLSGEEYTPAPRNVEKLPSDYLPPVIIGVGLLALGFGVASFLTGENQRMSVVTMFLGVAGPIVQWSLMMIGALIFVLLVMALLAAVGGG